MGDRAAGAVTSAAAAGRLARGAGRLRAPAAGLVTALVVALVGDARAMVQLARPQDVAALGAPAIAFEAVGRVGGAMTGVAVDGGRGVVSEGDHLVVLDLSEPLAPVPIGRGAALGGQARVAALRDGLAFVLETIRRPDDAEGAVRDVVLHVVDTADPTALRVRGSLALGVPAVADIAILGARAWLAAGPDGLIVVDVSDPENPVRRASVDVGGSAVSVAVVGTRLVVARASPRDVESDGVVVLDAASGAPASPPLSLGWLPREVEAVPGERFALVGGDEGVLVLDATTDPPSVVARSDGLSVIALAASAERAFVVGLREPALDVRIEALSLGPTPSLALLGGRAFTTAYGFPIGLAASGEGALATVPNRGLSVYWFDPADSGAVLQEAQRLAALGTPTALVHSAGRLWAVDVDAELWPIDARVPEAAVLESPLALVLSPGAPSWCDCLMGDAALDPGMGEARLLAAFHANATGRGGVLSVDLSAVGGARQEAVWTADSDPAIAGDPDHPLASSPVTAGERLHATAGMAWLSGDPLLTLVGFPASGTPGLAGYHLPGESNGSGGLSVAAAADGSAAWVGTDVAGIWRMNPPSPGAPEWRDGVRVPTEGAVRDLVWHGGVLYAADDLAGLRVHDAADGRALAVHGGVVAERLALAADGRTLWVAGVGQDAASGMKTHALAAFDVSAPAAPALMGQTVLNWRQEYTDFHPAPDVAAWDDLLAVADGDLGVSLLRIRRSMGGAALYVPVAER